MDLSNENPYPDASNQLNNSLHFTIHVPNSSSPNTSAVQNRNPNPHISQNPSSLANSVQDNFLLAPIPKGKRCGRLRNLTWSLNQVQNLYSPSSKNGLSSAGISSLVSSSRHVNKARMPNSSNLISKKRESSLNSGSSAKKTVDDMSDEIIVINKKATAEALIALTAGFPSDSLTEEEINYRVVSEVGGIEQINYVTAGHSWTLLTVTWFRMGILTLGGPWNKRENTGGARQPNVIVVGAGLAGLAAARQLMTFGFKVTILEGRRRAGGRVYTKNLVGDNRMAAVDLGGSVLTGTLGNPLGILARQLSFALHKAVNGEISQDVSLGTALMTFWKGFDEEEMNLFNWHIANLEYANASLISTLSLAFWDQDDPYDMGGDHCFLPGGIGRLVEALVENVPIHYGKTVEAIHYGSDGVQVAVGGGQIYKGDMVLCTVPLGVLKSHSIRFFPSCLRGSLTVRRLGYGLLNKVALLFPHSFWGTDLDTFGHLSDHPSNRGEFFLFYSYATVAGGPVLVALVAGEAAYRFENEDPTVSVRKVLRVLRGIYEPEGIEVPDPLQTHCTRWSSDPFSRGSYSSVAVGASADDYDIMAESVGNGRLFFAGEATNRRYPATMHGALLSGFREAANMAHYARVRDSGLTVEKYPSQNAHTCGSILADLFRRPDVEFGNFAILYGRKDARSKAILRVTLGGKRKKPDEHCPGNLLFEQFQSHFTQEHEFHIYRLLSKKQALELREVRGGDEARLDYLRDKLRVKLLGRKGLGPSADAVIASIQAERSKRKSSSTGGCPQPKHSYKGKPENKSVDQPKHKRVRHTDTSVGDGKSINVWHDPWLPDSHNAFVSTPNQVELEHIRVHNLMKNDVLEWDYDVISDKFNEMG
ncbi:hypothetical protein DH2020_030729 [Rehmannia glutinosa]|uniref:Amine oxidase domain-containing protein n=1 Tax=Rehmannia glutinosa TaxID=99300 RepID=A0ABR0VJX4_REHGL